MTFAEFYETRYLPTHNIGPRHLSATRQTVDEFLKFAGGDVRAEDIDRQTLRQFQKALIVDGVTRRVARRKLDLIESVRRDALPDSEPMLDVPPLPEAAPGSLAGYLPLFLLTTARGDRAARARYLAASRDFATWYGADDVPLDAIDCELIDQFEEAATTPMQRRTAGTIRTVMRTIDPMKFPDPRLGTKLESDADPQGGSVFVLRELYLQQYEPRALRTKRPNTKRLYVNTLNAFDEFLEQPATIDDLDDVTVGSFAAWYLAKGRSKFTVNKHLFNLLAIWRWAHHHGIVAKWPDVELEKPPKRTPVAWSADEMRKLYKTARETPGTVGPNAASDWWAALILLLWDSGERIGAIMGLSWNDVDLDGRWVRFDAEDRKGGAEDNACQISSASAAALRKLKREGDVVFPWPFAPTYIYRSFEAILRRAGLPTDARSKFHRIRRTVASHFEAAGGNATELLGHTKRAVTLAYIDRRLVPRQQAVDLLFVLD